MREVVILGVGLHKFGRFPDKSIRELGRVAIEGALQESAVPFKDIQVAYVGHVYQSMGTGHRVVTQFGQTGIPIINVEVACTSSTQALVRAAYDIALGLYDVALAAGVEKMGRGLIPGTSEARSYEEIMGLAVMPATYAFQARKHMEKYGTTFRQLALCSVKEHNNGALNPMAHYQQRMTVEEVMVGRMIADPITLYMCSPNSDGASAAILCEKKVARKYMGKLPITVAAWALSSGLPSREDDEEFSGVGELAKQVFQKASVGPVDIDVAQVHDAFSPAEIFVPESLGLIPKGEGGRWVEEGKTEIGGRIPINTDGGLVSRGHPVGATGLAQVAELVRQLRGEAGPRQVARAKVALQHNTGIGGTALVVYKK